MRNQASEINTWQHLERQEQHNLCAGVTENEGFQTQWHGLPCACTSKRPCVDEVLQSQAVLSLGRCLADVGGSMFRSQYLTKMGRPFTQEQPVIGEAELSCSLCITFSLFAPALPETMKSNQSPFFFAYLSFLLSHPFICALQKKHKQQHIPQSIFLKGSATHSSLINEKSVIIYFALCMTDFLLWKTKVGTLALLSFKMTKNGALYSKSFEAIWWLCIRNGQKFELLFIENLLTWPRSLS